ncbi:MAG: DUF424 domain-containing protein [Candidatus Methanofastidiosia archaeon]
MYVYIKVYEVKGEVMVACCDEDILGKSFSEGELHLNVSEKFYFGEKLPIEKVSFYLQRATILNLVGKNVISEAIKLGLVDEKKILKVGKIQHAQMVTL